MHVMFKKMVTSNLTVHLQYISIFIAITLYSMSQLIQCVATEKIKRDLYQFLDV